MPGPPNSPDSPPNIPDGPPNDPNSGQMFYKCIRVGYGRMTPPLKDQPDRFLRLPLSTAVAENTNLVFLLLPLSPPYFFGNWALHV